MSWLLPRHAPVGILKEGTGASPADTLASAILLSSASHDHQLVRQLMAKCMNLRFASLSIKTSHCFFAHRSGCNAYVKRVSTNPTTHASISNYDRFVMSLSMLAESVA